MPELDGPEAFAGPARRIEDDRPWLDAAEDLGCRPAALRAVAEVESRGAPFLPDGRPPILFERHVFSRRTGRAHDAAHPGVSSRRPGGYRGGAAEYERLAEALALDRRAALESASWGRFQIMGFNHAPCGYREVEDFVEAICADEAAQLDAFVAFVKANRLDRALRARDWAGFARGYNGPDFRRNAYDEKLAQAYRRHAAEAGGGGAGEFGGAQASESFRVETLRELQRALNYLGAEAGPADGLMGPRTRAAIRRFQAETRLPRTGAPGPGLMQAVQAVYFALGGPEGGVAG